MKRLAIAVVALNLFDAPQTALAAPTTGTDFTVTTGQTQTSPQTLGSPAGQTGTVESGGVLTSSDPNTIVITLTGDGNTSNPPSVSTIVNNGTISNTATTTSSGDKASAIRSDTKNTTLTLTNNAGGVISSLVDDAVHMDKGTDKITVYNYGIITAGSATIDGGQALDFNSLNSGNSVVYNYSTGVIQAYGEDAIHPGVSGVVYNDGLIQSLAQGTLTNAGIDAKDNSGVAIYNATNGLGSGVTSATTGTGSIIGSHHGIGGGDSTTNITMTVVNGRGGLIEGLDGSGINIDGTGAAENVTVTNYGIIRGNGVTGDGDGVDVDGVVNLTNGGTIISTKAYNDASEGVTVGGGTITNLAGGLIEGDNINGGVGVGITLAGVDKDTSGNPLPDGEVQAIYQSSTIDNSGTIRGQTDSAIRMSGTDATTNTVTIINRAGGLIEGGGTTTNAAIWTNNTQTNITDYGTIQADSNGKAIDFGSSSGSSLTVAGGSARIIGDIIGSTQGDTWVSITPGAGNTFSYSGNLSNLAPTAATTSYGLYLGAGTTAFNGSTISGTNSTPTTVGVDNGGTLAVSNGLTVNGSLTFNPGATYQVAADSAGTTASKVHVTGAASLNGSTLSLGSGYTASRSYDILTADGGVNGTFGAVTANYTFLMPALSYGANDVNLNMVRNSTTFASVAQGGGNELAAARALDSLPASSPLYNQIVVLNGAQAAAAYKALSGESQASTVTSLQSVGATAASLPLAHLQANLGAGMLSGSPTADAGSSDAAADASTLPRSAAYPVWAQVFGSWGAQGGSNDTSRINSASGGLYAGTDRDVGDGWRLGGALGYAHSDLSAEGVTANTNIDSYTATVYGGKAFETGPGALKLSGGLAYTWHDVASQRSVTLGSLSQSLNANYDASTSQIFGELGYALPLDDKTTIEPFAGANWSSLNTHGFTESGGSAALTSQGGTTNLTTTTLGLHGSTSFMLHDTQGTLHATLGWRHTFGDVSPQTTLAFQDSQSFTVSGAPIARNAAAVELGADIAVTRNTTVSLSYDGQYGGGNRQHSGIFNVRTRF